jgi:hypothetical protein
MKGLPIYEAEERAAYTVHTGDFRYEYSKPERLARVLDRFPKLTVIGAHSEAVEWDICVYRVLIWNGGIIYKIPRARFCRPSRAGTGAITSLCLWDGPWVFLGPIPYVGRGERA